MNLKKYSVSLKMFLVGFLILLLFIPLLMIGSVVDERQHRLFQAESTIVKSWGGPQVIGAPIVVVPFVDKNALTRHAFFLAEEVNITGEMTSRIRNLGLFEALLYSSVVNISGKFNKPEFNSLEMKDTKILWEQSFLIFDLHNNQGLKEDPNLTIDGHAFSMLPTNFYFDRALWAPIDWVTNNAGSINFNLKVKLNGHESLAFMPNAKTVSATLTSSWPNPNFSGYVLPDKREITAQGFRATWQTTYLNRNYPQAWRSWSDQSGNEYNEFSARSLKDENAVFQVNLISPFDTYQITTRSVKYGYLFVFLTMASFFLIEVLCKERLHPIQYLFIGFAICIFFLLLLALSEHLSFGLAYGIASIAVTALIGFYSAWVLHKKQRGLWLGLLVGCLYSYLYTLLNAEDYALLMGTIGLFIILTIIMILTRNVHWYALDERGNA